MGLGHRLLPPPANGASNKGARHWLAQAHFAMAGDVILRFSIIDVSLGEGPQTGSVGGI